MDVKVGLPCNTIQAYKTETNLDFDI